MGSSASLCERQSVDDIKKGKMPTIPPPFYLSHNEQTMQWIQQTLASRERLRMTAAHASDAELSKIPQSTLSSYARRAFAAKESMDPLNLEKNR